MASVGYGLYTYGKSNYGAPVYHFGTATSSGTSGSTAVGRQIDRGSSTIAQSSSFSAIGGLKWSEQTVQADTWINQTITTEWSEQTVQADTWTDQTVTTEWTNQSNLSTTWTTLSKDEAA